MRPPPRLGRLPFALVLAGAGAAAAAMAAHGKWPPLEVPRRPADAAWAALAGLLVHALAVAMIRRSRDLLLPPLVWSAPAAALAAAALLHPDPARGVDPVLALAGCLVAVAAALALLPGRAHALAPEKTLVL